MKSAMRFIIISRLVECDVMEFQELSTLVSNVGFPIAMCLLLLHRMSTQDKIYHETEEKLRQVIAENTKAINKLVLDLHKKEV